MFISLAESRTTGFLKWSAVHRPDNDDDDDSGGTNPAALITPPPDRNVLVDDQPHRPWAIPGVGGAF